MNAEADNSCDTGTRMLCCQYSDKRHHCSAAEVSKESRVIIFSAAAAVVTTEDWRVLGQRGCLILVQR